MKVKINTTHDLGPIFKAARQSKGLTIAKVAALSGFSLQTIINIEKNIGSTRTETLLAVGKAVGITVEVSANIKEKQSDVK